MLGQEGDEGRKLETVYGSTIERTLTDTMPSSWYTSNHSDVGLGTLGQNHESGTPNSTEMCRSMGRSTVY